MSATQALLDRYRLGSHQTVTIDGTTRYSTELAPGIYSLEVETEACYVRALAAASGTVDSTCTWIKVGGQRYFHVAQPENGTKGKVFVGVVRSGSGTGTLHIARVDEDC